MLYPVRLKSLKIQKHTGLNTGGKSRIIRIAEPEIK